VEPLSVNHKTSTAWEGKGEAPSLTTCPSRTKHLSYENVKANPQKVVVGPIIWTYDVQWRESDIKWASRWDVYLSMDHAVPDKVHWFSIINSILIVMFLAIIVAMILVRSLHRDISQYNRVSEEKAIVLFLF
jgi:transmembrane 9 superfamily protein 2/4